MIVSGNDVAIMFVSTLGNTLTVRFNSFPWICISSPMVTEMRYPTTSGHVQKDRLFGLDGSIPGNTECLARPRHAGEK
jgi:hypothetical protein